MTKSHASNGTYTVPAACANCGWQGTLRLSKGYEAPRPGGWSFHAGICPTCGCQTVAKTSGAVA